jgi:hypothetical protein
MMSGLVDRVSGKHGTVGYLHVFAQHCEHDTAEIVGTKAGLEALASAVAHALKYREAESNHVFVNDGEGYKVLVKRADDADGLPTPYRYQYLNEEVQTWRERAFEAEASLFRLKKIAREMMDAHSEDAPDDGRQLATLRALRDALVKRAPQLPPSQGDSCSPERAEE